MEQGHGKGRVGVRQAGYSRGKGRSTWGGQEQGKAEHGQGGAGAKGQVQGRAQCATGQGKLKIWTAGQKDRGRA